MGTFAESAGTYVNCEGRWQSQSGAAAALEVAAGVEVPAAPALPWISGSFSHQSSKRYSTKCALCAQAKGEGYQGAHAVGATAAGAPGIGLIDVPMYSQTDALVRRAPSLQRTREGACRS